jgi:hypothetical protein
MNAVPTVVRAVGIIEAWKAGAQLLIDEGDRFNLAVHIEKPCELDEKALRSCDPRRVAKVTSVFDVASTIFPPERLWRFNDRRNFYRRFSKVYSRGQRRRTWAWGTYFQRLIEFGGPADNQVERAISVLADWGRDYHAVVVLHLSAATLDKPRPMGAPCWQYGQFNVDDTKRVSLTAVYRSQDYFKKSLGNFAGLTRLLKFVCSQSGTKPDSLTCLSAFASLGPSKASTKKLLKLC